MAAVPGTTRLIQQLDERYSGLTVLLIGADLFSFAVTALVMKVTPLWAALIGVLLLVCRATARLYRARLRLSYFDDIVRELIALAAANGLAVIAVLVLSGSSSTVGDAARLIAAFAVVSILPRFVAFQISRWARRRWRRGMRTLVVGTGPVGVDLARQMLDHPEFGLQPVGFITANGSEVRQDLPLPVLGGSLPSEIVGERAGAVVFATSDVADAHTANSAMLARGLGCSVLIVPHMFELYHDAGNIERLRSYPLVRLTLDPTRRPTWWLKRAIDGITAATALTLLLPVLAVITVAVLVESGRPILFRQERIGMDGRRFAMFKFRSLRPSDPTEEQTRWTIVGDLNIGPVGRYLRRTSLDELPQLWNILRGDMSLVGPRPERPAFVEQFAATHERYWARHRVPSGLTGLAQVNGLRGDTSIADRVRHDNYYIANWSMWLDIKIILLTFREVLRRDPR